MGLRVRNIPLTNIPKGFSREMTLEVAEGRLEVSSDYMQETHAFAQFYAFCTKINAIWINFYTVFIAFHAILLPEGPN